MRNLAMLLVFMYFCINTFGLGKEYVINTGESTFYINNNPGAYLSIRFATGEFEQTTEPNIFKLYGKYTQLVSMNYDRRRYFVKGSPLAEGDLLVNFMEKEVSYLRKTMKRKLKPNYELLLSSYKKQFLIWSYQVQNKRKVEQEKELQSLQQFGLIHAEQDSIVHQINLTFVANKKIFSFVYPVFIHDDLDTELNKIKTLVDGLNTYGFPIDIKALAQKEYAQLNHVHFNVSDEEAELTIYIPDWMNVCQYPASKALLATMPEFNNFMSVLNVQWEIKDGRNNFKYFINSHLSDSTITSYKEITDQPLHHGKYFEVLKHGYFKCVYVFMEGTHANCWASFVASPTTYKLDMPKFNEFVSGINLN